VNRTARSLVLLTVALAAFLADWYWPQARNEFFVLLGSRNETGGWYGFHSGAGGALYMQLLPVAILFYCHHTCHDSWKCLRWGKYEAAGGMFRLCRHHHPDLDGERPRRDLIHRMHREHQDRAAGRAS
jgi:hypothetical protein